VGGASTKDDAQALAEARGAALPPKAVRCIEANRTRPLCDRRLLAILNLVQDATGYLSSEHLHAVSERTGVPLPRLESLAAFYHYFRLAPRGQHLVSVCLGTACHVKGAALVGQRFMEALGIPFGGTTPDGQFTLEPTRCLGICAQAPVVMIDRTLHGGVTVEAAPLLLDLHRHQAPPAGGRRARMGRGAARVG